VTASRLIFRFGLPIVFLTVASVGAAQSQALRPFKRVRTAAAVKDTTARFKQPIVEQFTPVHREPENPYTPPWKLKRVTSTSRVRLGKITTQQRALPGPRFPAIDATGWSPADPSVAVGRNHVALVVNSSIALFTKVGTKQLQQTLATFFDGMGAGTFIFDPKVVYDRQADRFYVIALEKDTATSTSKILLAASDDGDPNGTWFKYRVESKFVDNVGKPFWLDYPGFGFNKDAIVVTGNLFGFTGGGYAGVSFHVIPKAQLLVGSALNVSYIRDANAASVQLAEINDATNRVYGVADWNTANAKIYALTDPLGAPSLSSTFVALPSFTYPSASVPSKPGTLDALDGRIFNTAWRNGRLIAAHAVTASGDSRMRVRWYEFATNGYPVTFAPTLVQSGEILPAIIGGNHFHMPAVAINSFGDIGAIFTRSSTTIPADVMVTGRTSSDPEGTMGQPTRLQASEGSGYGGTGSNRWGDYFQAVVDPVDETTFWGVAMAGNPNGQWKTHIVSWQVTAPLTLNQLSLGAQSVIGGNSTTATVTFSPAAPSGGATLRLSTNDPSVQLPETVPVPGGSTSVTFDVPTTSVNFARDVTISATLTGSTRATILQVRPRIIQGSVTFGNFVGAPTSVPVTVEVRRAGSSEVAQTATLNLVTNGTFTLRTSLTGTVDVYVRAGTWLRRKVANVNIENGASGLSFSLTNGDANKDNQISTSDYAVVNAAFGSVSGGTGWNANADLNGDGKVDATDLAIVRANFRKVGD